MPDADGDLALIAAAAREAGAIALSHFRRDPAVWAKAGGSPVSAADLAVDAHLKTRLAAARPDYGWLSEETADGPERLTRARVFVVDPIDGTRAFLAGETDWAVSIAVVEAGRPVASALYAPAIDQMLTATLGGGAWGAAGRLAASDRTTLSGARLAAPRKFLDAEEIAASPFAERMVVRSLALRLAKVAEGLVDIAYGTSHAHDWDLAAADLLVHEAGGRFTIPSGEPLVYNRPVPRHAALVAATPGVHEAARALLLRLVEGESTGRARRADLPFPRS